VAGWLARQWAESAGEFGVAGIAQMVKPGACNDRALSAVRGSRDWCPQEVGLALAGAAGWSGELVGGS
jgi:predicted nucleic acid-binding Zn ribbon protein